MKALTIKHTATLRDRIAALEEACQFIEQLTARCPGNAEHECPILNELEQFREQPDAASGCDRRNAQQETHKHCFH